MMKPSGPKTRMPAQRREENHEVVHLRVVTDEPRAEHVVDRPDNQCVERRQRHALPDLARGHEDEARRHPDEGAADQREDREDDHHDRPEHHVRNADDPERQAGHGPLDDADHDRALDRGSGDRDEPILHLCLVVRAQRQVAEHRREHGRAVDEQEEHRVEQQEEVEDERDRHARRLRERPDQEPADGVHDVAGARDDLVAIRFDAGKARARAASAARETSVR